MSTHKKSPEFAADIAPLQGGLPAPDTETTSQTKQPFTTPRLTYVPPKLVKHGNVTELTGFIGTFSP